MLEISKGDKIRHIKTEKNYVVDGIENIENIDLVFTTDTKCFPLSEVEKCFDSILSSYFFKLLHNQHISIEEETKAMEIIGKSKIVEIIRN